jgi:hypothetical protein
MVSKQVHRHTRSETLSLRSISLAAKDHLPAAALDDTLLHHNPNSRAGANGKWGKLGKWFLALQKQPRLRSHMLMLTLSTIV